MSKAVKSEIIAMQNSGVVAALRRDAMDARRLCMAIDRFVNGSSRKLTGQNYDEAREMAAQYIPILQKRVEVSNAMADAIKSGCLSLAWYMGKYEVLDEALRGEYEQRLREAEAALAALQSMSFDDTVNMFDYWGAYFTYQSIIDECRDYLAKLDGLPGADASAYEPIVEALNVFNS